MATTAEAVAMARLDGGNAAASGTSDPASLAIESVERRADTVAASVEEAERLLDDSDR
ncbi:hypothetical protein GCM10027562_42060 [Arthrobacter pigmenti]